MNKSEYLDLITSPRSTPLNLTHGDARSTWLSFFPTTDGSRVSRSSRSTTDQAIVRDTDVQHWQPAIDLVRANRGRLCNRILEHVHIKRAVIRAEAGCKEASSECPGPLIRMSQRRPLSAARTQQCRHSFGRHRAKGCGSGPKTGVPIAGWISIRSV
ncbi:hypothetical protein BGZ61DRAFT_452605 [Ilyonectria robusta]|uniref:uncharacterized protein n=1 Tax=Ilyonectria robusta TaxID=1079257 RepID=UPI001E8E7306|nr:uncharacterized protein BGZ61DRAFT_452605 [Ilyonectria robusta]KAH8694825.1 hypothetical protein BGZ61DRAFT_452605 [Ilyonectria robusta]